LQPFLEADIPSDRLGRAIADLLFPGNDQGRIPLVGVTGSHGTTEVARLTAEFLRLSGKLTGLACSKGLFCNRRQLEHGDCADWSHARRILMNRSIHAAVIENNANIILGQGLAYDRCQVGVVTAIEPELHYGQYHITDAEYVFRIFRTQIDVVLAGGSAVLPADNPLALDMIPLCDGEVILFAADPSLPALATHLAGGGRAVTITDGSVAMVQSGHTTALADFATIPFLTADSQPIRIAEVLAAVGAAWALDIPEHVIRTGLETFSSHPANPDAPVPAKPAAPLVDPL
jgi:cyanophycin synthetase